MATRPPDWQMRPPRRQHRTLWSDLAGLWRRFRGLPILVQLIVGVLLLVLFVDILSILFGSDGGTRVASQSTTSAPTLPTSTTTTIAAGLPAGDDATVKSVIDGDSFELDNGTKVRLIGLDAPDTEVTACFSAEATTHLQDLIPAGRVVRLVYDTTRTDRFGRTLAYVFRLPDGLFINLAQVRDGFATQVTTGPFVANTMYAREIGDAEADAKTTKRGLWGNCASATSTTSRSTATTRPVTTEAPNTTQAPATTEAPTTTVAANAVENEICFIPNAAGVLPGGRPGVCAQADDGYYRWRAA